MNFFAISAFVNVVTSIVLGLLVLFASPRTRLNQLFFLFASSVTVWSFAYFLWQVANTAADAIFWVRVLMGGAIFIPFFYFHFVVRFLNLQEKLRVAVWAGYIFAAFFSVINWTPFFIASVIPQDGFPFWPIATPLFSFFLLIWLLYVIYFVYLLFRRLQSVDSQEEKAQILYILIGTIVGSSGGCTNYFLWYGIHIPPYGNGLLSVYLGMVAYAISKHRLFDAKVAMAELLVFFLWLVGFVRMLLGNTVGDQVIDALLLLILIIVGIFLIQSVNKEVAQREKIEKLAEDLEKTNERQEGLIHFIGHEVKGFLAKDTNTFASLLEGDFGILPKPLAPLVQNALGESRQGEATVATILKAANLKKGTVTYTKEPFDLKALVEGAIEKEKFIIEKKGLTLNFTALDGSYQMTGDKSQIADHVLRNLIDNAVNYTPTGSITLSLKRSMDKIIFMVQDTGVGITEEDKEHLFTEGGHGKDSQKVNVHSTGYGLFIAKSIVEAHGGSIRAESEGAGKGSTFVVEFPT